MRLDPLPILLVLVCAACGGGDSQEPAAAPAAVATEDAGGEPRLSTTPPPAAGDGSSPAINSIAVDPADGTVLVGTGPALFVIEPGAKEGERILGRLTTPSGEGTVSGNLVVRFTRAGELLGTGHPQEGPLPENLPLIRSTDRGATWEAVPNTAEADYHELEVFGNRIVAVNVDSPDILVSGDGGVTWQTRTPPSPPIDVVVDPGDPDRWAVSTEQGTFLSNDGGGSWRPREPTSGARLAWPKADALFSLDRNGKVRVSADGGETWRERGDVGGLPSEFTASAKGELFAAVVGGKIRTSANDGKTWSTFATVR